MIEILTQSQRQINQTLHLQFIFNYLISDISSHSFTSLSEIELFKSNDFDHFLEILLLLHIEEI